MCGRRPGRSAAVPAGGTRRPTRCSAGPSREALGLEPGGRGDGARRLRASGRPERADGARRAHGPQRLLQREPASFRRGHRHRARRMRAGRRLVFVAGTMRELGRCRPRLHAEVAAPLVALEPDLLAAVGDFVPALAPYAGAAGRPPDHRRRSRRAGARARAHGSRVTSWSCSRHPAALRSNVYFRTLSARVARTPTEARCSITCSPRSASTYIIFNLFNYISFRAAGAMVTALLLAFVVGPADHRPAAGAQDRAGHPGRGPGQPPGQAGHADDGRADHPARDRRADAALGPAHQPLRGGRDAGHALDGRASGFWTTTSRSCRGSRAAWWPSGSWSGQCMLRPAARAVPRLQPGGAGRRSCPATATTLPFFKYLVVQLRALALRRCS